MPTCTELNLVAPVIAVSSAKMRNVISFDSRAADSCRQAAGLSSQVTTGNQPCPRGQPSPLACPSATASAPGAPRPLPVLV